MRKHIAVTSPDAGSASFSDAAEVSKPLNDTLWSRITAMFSKVSIHRRSRELRICETVSLGDKRMLALIACGEQRFLIAATAQNISLLQALGAEQKEEDQNQEPS